MSSIKPTISKFSFKTNRLFVCSSCVITGSPIIGSIKVLSSGIFEITSVSGTSSVSELTSVFGSCKLLLSV